VAEVAVSKQAGDVERMFSSIAPRYDLVNSVLSLGIHKIWRKKLLSYLDGNCLKGPALDLCTGTADLAIALRQQGVSKVIGLDFCLPMLELGKAKVGSKNSGLMLGQGDALSLPFKSETFSLVTVAFGVRNFENLSQGLAEIFRVLRPGGTLMVLEFGQPSIPVWRQIYHLYSRWIMPGIGGLLSGNRKAYTYLPETSANFPCRQQFMDLLESDGYLPVRYRSLSGGIAYIYQCTKPPALRVS